MTLTFGRAPFGAERGSFDFPVPEQVRYWEPWRRRMRAVLAGETVLDSRRGIMVHETGSLPTIAYPLEDLDASFLREAKPDDTGARRWDLVHGERIADGAVTAFSAPDGASSLDNFVTIDFGAMDRWFEEDEAVYAHTRDPYHRVDVRMSSRHVVVRHQGRVVADSVRPMLLFETGLPVRYYVPFADVDLGRLERSDTVSECPYKGDGQHWHLASGSGARVDDVAWSLPSPIGDASAARDHVCFYVEKVEVDVDGERVTE